MKNPENTGGAANMARGTGVLPASTDLNFTQGTIADTGNALDFAIKGSGFFCLRDSAGNLRYTRNGSFSISTERDGNFLTADDGAYVLDSNGQKIKTPDDGSAITVASDGSIPAADGKTVKLGVYEFPNPGGLSKTGDSRFAVTGASGAAAAASGSEIRQAALEGSNVELSDEITDLMQAQRMFSLSCRALNTADEMEGLANNIRR
jgi:flagellar basal-body rod protein FlgG